MMLEDPLYWMASHEELAEIADTFDLATLDEANAMETDELIALLNSEFEA